MITIIDYGLGNLGSIQNMLRKLGYPAVIGGGKESIQKATKLILPGVGAFDTGMNQLKASGLLPVLNERVLDDRIPTLGICLGAQLMTRSSEEGVEAGLGWFAASTQRMRFEGIAGRWPLPNIGWRDVQAKADYPLLRQAPSNPRFYFVHSYFLLPDDPERDCSMTTRYGFEYCCGMSRNNIHAAQFHPEKSHKYGLQFLRNFAEITHA